MSNKQQAQQSNEEIEMPPLADLAAFTAGKATKKVEILGERFPIYGLYNEKKNPNGMKVGQTIGGLYCGTESRGEDEQGDERIVQVFKSESGKKFGLWHRGGMNLLNRVPVGTFVTVTYSRFDAEAVRPKPKHVFDITMEDGVELLPPPTRTAARDSEA